MIESLTGNNDNLSDAGIPDLTIVGAGPCGLYAAFCAGMRGMSTVLIDSLEILGGQLTTMYPEKFVYDVAGFAKVLASELADNLVEQALLFDPAVHLNEKIINLERVEGTDGGGLIKLESTSGREFLSRTVLLALGAGAFLPRKLKLASAEKFEQHGVHYVVRNTGRFDGKRLLIVGGGDTALDWALQLHGKTTSTMLIHRRDKFRAVESSVKDLIESDVEVRTFWEVMEIHGEDHVEAATIFNNKTDDEETIDVDEIIVCMGFLADLRFLKSWGLLIHKNAVDVDLRMETTIKGVFGCGDVITHPSKIKLISTGQGEAATAVNFAYTTLHPDAKLFPGHSSTMDLPLK